MTLCQISSFVHSMVHCCDIRMKTESCSVYYIKFIYYFIIFTGKRQVSRKMLESKTQTVAILFRGYFVMIKLWLHIYFITIRLIKTNIFFNLCFFAEGPRNKNQSVHHISSVKSELVLAGIED